MRLGRLLESADSDLKKLALLLQTAFIEDLDWDLELNRKDGFFYGELIMCNGQPQGEIFIFVGKETVFVLHEPDALKTKTIPEILESAHETNIGTNVFMDPTREGASKFVRDYYLT